MSGSMQWCTRPWMLDHLVACLLELLQRVAQQLVLHALAMQNDQQNARGCAAVAVAAAAAARVARLAWCCGDVRLC